MIYLTEGKLYLAEELEDEFLEAYFRFNGLVLAVQMTIQVLLAIILMDIQ